jgi:hypothetical protein
MLGIRRASVIDVLRPLPNDGLVRSNHGTITILIRKGLEAALANANGLSRINSEN